MLKLTSQWQHCYSGAIHINLLETRFRLKITFCYASNFNIKFDSRQENCITPFFLANQPFCSIPPFFRLFFCFIFSFLLWFRFSGCFPLFSFFISCLYRYRSQVSFLLISFFFNPTFVLHVLMEGRKWDKKNTKYFTQNVLIIFLLFVINLEY